MPIKITMPRLSDTMEEGTLVKWRAGVGDAVSAGDHLADVETDKATMELQTFDDGKVAKIVAQEGDTVAVGGLIAVLAEDGESVEDAAKAAEGDTGGGGGKAEPEGGEDQTKEDGGEDQAKEDGGGAGKRAEATEAAPKAQPSGGAGGGARIRVSPLARKLAEEHGLDLAQITGSGPDGRIIKRDVLQAAEAGAAAPAASPTARQPAAPAPGVQPLEAKKLPLSGMRKTIAKRLVEAKSTVPHFQVSVRVDMDPLLELRQTLNRQLEPQGVKLSVNDFVVRAVALACVRHPVVNSSWAGDAIQQHGTVNVGVAVALPAERGGGLVVPVLRDAQNLGLRSIGQQTQALAKKARESGLTTQEMDGGTITLSNLGMYGVDQFNAIINPPQAAILAVGGAIEQPVVKGGQIVVGRVMTATLSADHRVIDGAIAAEYLTTLRELLENPAGLLV